MFVFLVIWFGYSQASQQHTDPITIDDFNLPIQDDQGWSVLVPSADSRLVYVDSALGDDLTAVAYSPSDPEIGSDPQQPAGSIKAFRTLAAATANLRANQPDWLLLRSGEVWEESLLIKNGRSRDERQVATSWGRGPRPELRTGSGRGIENNQLSEAAIIGIRFWAHTRDPEGPYFVSYDGSSGISMFGRTEEHRQVRDVLIEDCHFHSYATNTLISFYKDDPRRTIKRFVVRRSIISRNFSTSAHSQGLGFSGQGQPVLPAILLEENLFDHNGWRVQKFTGSQIDRTDGQATLYNHNTYFADTSGVIFNRNIFMRASSIGNKWTSSEAGKSAGIVLDNNLYIDGEIGISMGGNDPGPFRFRDITIRNNVFTDIGRSRPTNRTLSWGLEILDWDKGLVHNNLFINQDVINIGNTFAIKIKTQDATRDLVISSNTIANLHADPNSPPLRLLDGANVVNVTIVDNTIHSKVANPAIKLISGGYDFSGTNRYYTQSTPETRFQVDGINTDLAGWISATGDVSAISDAPEFVDNQRTLETYIELLSLGTEYQDFIDAVYLQSKANWNPALTAGSINEWFRQGFRICEAQLSCDTQGDVK